MRFAAGEGIVCGLYMSRLAITLASLVLYISMDGLKLTSFRICHCWTIGFKMILKAEGGALER